MEGNGSRGLLTHENDVVCLVKRFCSDAEACQLPVLVLPQAFLARLQGTLPVNPRPLVPWNQKRRMMWLELAELILRQSSSLTPKVSRSVNYLLMVGKAEAPPTRFQDLPWHEEDMPNDLARLEDLNESCLRLLLPTAIFKARLIRRR